MTLRKRLEQIEHEYALADQQRSEKLRAYYERTIPIMAQKLAIPTNQVTLETMSQNGDQLSALIIKIRRRIEESSHVTDLL